MKKVSYSLLTSFAILGLNVLPSQALQQQSNQVATAQNQIQNIKNGNSYVICIWRAMGIKICY